MPEMFTAPNMKYNINKYNISETISFTECGSYASTVTNYSTLIN